MPQELKKVATGIESGVNDGPLAIYPIFADAEGYTWTYDPDETDGTLCECAPTHMDSMPIAIDQGFAILV